MLGAVLASLGAFKMRILMALVMIGMVCGLVGCATVGGWFKKPENQQAVKVVVTVSVVDLITKHPEYKPKILAITAGVKQYINAKPEARAGDIIALVNSQIDYGKLKPDEALIVQTLLVTVQTDLESKIKEGGVSQDTIVAVGQLIDWVETAATF